MKKPICTIVGLAGGSGSGKTRLAELIKSSISDDKVTTLSMDSYYKPIASITTQERHNYNFDRPEAFDISMLITHLQMLKAGEPIPNICYDYSMLQRINNNSLIPARPVVLLEGILALAIPSIRSLLDIKVYVETSADIRFIRRCRRDIEFRHRAFEDIASQYERSVRNMHRSLVEPSKDFADLIIPFDQTGERGVEILVKSLVETVKQRPATFIIWEQDQSEMILIPAGKFLMGSNDTEIMQVVREYQAEINWFNDERPQHNVYLKSFYIDKYPVTNRQYEEFLKRTNYKKPETWNIRRYRAPDLPVIGVSWFDAMEYCKWSRKRLLCEAEWEKAARGINARLYPWGNSDPDGKSNYGNKYGGPTPVNKFIDGASPYGVMDMVGNVWEWVSDWYDSRYYSNAPPEDPLGPDNGLGRCVRGGSWINNPTMLRCAERDYRRLPHRDLKYFGFRCAADITEI